MSTVLVTGASGFIGQALSLSLSREHSVVCMSRQDPDLGIPYVRGEFHAFEDLRRLDKYAIDVVIHLGAVTGGCLERDGILVNVEGTRCLMRYLIDRGCSKFVMASSIAAVGFQNVKFRPLELPISEEHPCLDRDGYGLSKYLMEEVTRYYQRQNEDLDVINLRLASICPDERPLPLVKAGPIVEWSIGAATVMCRSDAVRAFSLAAAASHKPGVRIMNATGPKAWVKDPVAKVVRAWYGGKIDASYYEQPGHEWDSLFHVRRIEEKLGFVAQRLPG